MRRTLWATNTEALLDPKELRGLSEDDLKVYGENDLNVLLRYYGKQRREGGEMFRSPINSLQAKVQYNSLRDVLLKSMVDRWSDLSVTERCRRVWSEIDKNMGQNAPHFMLMATAVLIAQPHCVDNERVHGVRKLIESDKRGKLRLETVDKLLRIGYNSPTLSTREAEHFYGLVMRYFEGTGNRRL